MEQQPKQNLRFGVIPFSGFAIRTQLGRNGTHRAISTERTHLEDIAKEFGRDVATTKSGVPFVELTPEDLEKSRVDSLSIGVSSLDIFIQTARIAIQTPCQAGNSE